MKDNKSLIVFLGFLFFLSMYYHVNDIFVVICFLAIIVTLFFIFNKKYKKEVKTKLILLVTIIIVSISYQYVLKFIVEKQVENSFNQKEFKNKNITFLGLRGTIYQDNNEKKAIIIINNKKFFYNKKDI